MSRDESGGRLGFLDSLTRFFRKESQPEASDAPKHAPARDFKTLQSNFEAALRGLDAKIDERRASAAATESSVAGSPAAEKSVDQKHRRMEEAHRAIRDDIEKMHLRLGTGIKGADLGEISTFLAELDANVAAGRDSHDMLPRARCAITQKLQAETGGLALARLIALLQAQAMTWPDPTQPPPGATAEDVERSRQRRLAESREVFLSAGLKRTADRMLGIVSAWGSEYPDRGAALWEESVLEGVGAGIRGKLLQEFVALLQRDQDLINARAEDFIGAELAKLHDVLRDGVQSLDKANQAVASALRVLDDVVPQIAWEHIQAELPHARGDWSA